MHFKQLHFPYPILDTILNPNFKNGLNLDEIITLLCSVLKYRAGLGLLCGWGLNVQRKIIWFSGKAAKEGFFHLLSKTN